MCSHWVADKVFPGRKELRSCSCVGVVVVDFGTLYKVDSEIDMDNQITYLLAATILIYVRVNCLMMQRTLIRN